MLTYTILTGTAAETLHKTNKQKKTWKPKKQAVIEQKWKPMVGGARSSMPLVASYGHYGSFKLIQSQIKFYYWIPTHLAHTNHRPSRCTQWNDLCTNNSTNMYVTLYIYICINIFIWRHIVGKYLNEFKSCILQILILYPASKAN